MDLKVYLPSRVILSKKRYESNDSFHEQRKLFNDSVFIRRYINRQRMHSQRMNSDALSAFLQEQTSAGGLAMGSLDKLLSQKILYSDLASLTDEDLELMGLKDQKERQNLLEFFAQLPNQNPTFEERCNKPEANTYNATIIKNATLRLKNMQHSLIEANYKVQIDVPDDALVGDKYFASKYLINALDELKKESEEIENDLDELSKVINPKRHRFKLYLGLTAKSWLLLAFIMGLTAASSIWLMRYYKQ